MNYEVLENLTEDKIFSEFDYIIEQQDYMACHCYCTRYGITTDVLNGKSCSGSYRPDTASLQCDINCKNNCNAGSCYCYHIPPWNDNSGIACF